jgi:hypothetical protein
MRALRLDLERCKTQSVVHVDMLASCHAFPMHSYCHLHDQAYKLQFSHMECPPSARLDSLGSESGTSTRYILT